MNNPGQNKEIDYLLFLLVEGSLDAKGFESIETWLSARPQNREYYCNFVKDYAAMKMQVNAMLTPKENDGKTTDIFDREAWHALAEMENDADIVKIAAPEEPKILIQKVQHQAIIRKISKGSLYTLFAATAAIILIFVFARYAPQETGLKVAVLSDSIHAKWADMDGAMEKGEFVFTSRKSLLLQEGIVKLLFDNQAMVTIESPAEFEIMTGDQVKLNYGRLYAVIPQSAIGFAVQTQSARIIDLGTEFGIDASTGGDTSLHVMKGKITLIAGEKSNKVSMEVNEGAAKKVFFLTQTVSDIPCQKELFVRMIDSKEKLVWKGQNQISLADIVGGGNGLGTGQVNTGVDPVTGQKAKSVFEDKNVTNDYHPVPSNSFIDGVFVPNGRTEQVVSSMRHVFQECPVTSGIYYTGIINTSVTAGKEPALMGVNNVGALVLGANPDTAAARPSILMHANLGITFDLQAIRSMLPNSKVTCFRSPFGLAPLTDSMFNADFWVLVDGKLKYKHTQVNERGRAGLIDIELSDTDRFLTLVITDGGDRKEGTGRNETPIYGDWCVFMEPVLVLE